EPEPEPDPSPNPNRNASRTPTQVEAPDPDRDSDPDAPRLAYARRRGVLTNPMADRKLFGTDGVRGVANVAPMTGDTVMKLGMAVAARLKQPGRHTRIVIGKDTRLSGYMFETALASGIVAMGADVWLTGPLPTPGIAF